MPLLTTRKIETEKAGAVERRLVDGQGLYLRIVPLGTKSFQFRFTYAAKRQTMTLGTFPDLSLADARERARECRAILERGDNPATVHQDKRQAKIDALDVEQLIDEYEQKWLKLHFKRPRERAAILEKDLKPIFHILVPDVKPVQITTCVNKILERGKKVMANRFLQATRKLFQYAVDQHMRPDNPVTMTKAAAGGREVAKKTNLRFEQLATFYRMLHSPPLNVSRQMSWQTSKALQLMILTGQRPGEVVRIEWGEIDLAAGIWVIPAEFTKVPSNGDHTVHLSSQAIDLLKSIKERPDACNRRVFPSPDKEARERERSLRRHSLSETLRALQKAGLIEFAFTPHDLRRTFSSRMAELKQEPHVIEKILNHQMEGVMAVYNQYDYFPERKKALQTWGDQVERLSTDLLSGL
ncbi:tyrosine-type recombinase/integrase [Variovorax paradoxus]|uniref:Tyrosine-type recombinase/integrase n=1 Tax=Variovorax paradoxus TaxID=34073 RepID=A0A5Q0M768_VARPD|nr:site-specific integrase [Variovorax paradoxus]QFZ84657.1 tyrosine-type recombinase/integrase [Variovorax paradoxus]